MKYTRVLFVAVLGLAAAQEGEPNGDGGEDSADENMKEKAGQYGYCMEANCYDLLGMTKESKPAAIKRSYRRLAAAWHPDKTSHPDKAYALSLFQKYANAYEVLSSSEMRKNYDYVLDHPYEFPMHFLRMTSIKYAPKSDLRTVFIITIVAISALHYCYQLQHLKQSLQTIKSRPQYQERVKTIMADLAQGPKGKARSGAHRGDLQSAKRASSEKSKGAEFEERKLAAEQIIQEELADALPQAPTLGDTLAFAIFASPITCTYGFLSNMSWIVRFRVLGQAYGDDEMQYLTRKALAFSAADWAAIEDKERDELVAKELWQADNLAAHEEETAAPRGSKTGKEKRAARQKKHNIEPNPIEN